MLPLPPGDKGISGVEVVEVAGKEEDDWACAGWMRKTPLVAKKLLFVEALKATRMCLPFGEMAKFVGIVQL